MKKFLSGALALALLLSTAACGNDAASDPGSSGEPSQASSQETSEPNEVVEITYPTYRVGTNVSADTEAYMIDSFNEEFDGKYKLVVEELPSDVSYQEKMAVLATTNDLPDLVEGKGPVMNLAIKNGQAQDLTSYIEADPDYKSEVGEAAFASNTIDGKIYGVPDLNQCFGYFYNTEMFEQAGITPAETWDEWMSNLEAL